MLPLFSRPQGDPGARAAVESADGGAGVLSCFAVTAAGGDFATVSAGVLLSESVLAAAGAFAAELSAPCTEGGCPG